MILGEKFSNSYLLNLHWNLSLAKTSAMSHIVTQVTGPLLNISVERAGIM